MTKLKNWLYAEFIAGTKPFDWYFMGAGLLLQIVVITLCAVVPAMHDNHLLVTAVSGITGILSVTLCSRGKLSQYFFGYIQLFTYVFGVAIPEGLGGEVAENIVYATTMVIGIAVWIKKYGRRDDGAAAVKTKNMTVWAWIVTGMATAMLIVGGAMFLKYCPEFNIWLTGEVNPTPWLDSITTVVPLVGQMLMCFGYSDQWIFWFVEDVISLIMFAWLGNWIMVAQYVFWTANCVYGWTKWRKLSKEA